MKYFVLGALASGFLLYGLSMMYGATGSLEIPRVFEQIATGRINKRGAGLRPRLRRRRPGLQARRRALPHVGARRLPGRADRGDAADRRRAQVRGLRDHHPAARRRHARPGGRLAADVHRARRGLAGGGQHRRHRAEQPQAHAGLHHDRADGLRRARPVGRRRQRQHAVGRQRLQLGDVLHGELRAHDAGHLRPDHVPVAPGLRERGDRRPRRPVAAQPLGGRRDDGVHVLARRRAADGRLLRQAGGDPGAGHAPTSRSTSCWPWSPCCSR